MVGVFVEFGIAEVLAGEQAKLPEVVGNVLADVSDGAVGANDDLGVFIGDVSSLLRFCAGATHDPAVLVFACCLFVEDTLFDHESAGCVPEVER